MHDISSDISGHEAFLSSDSLHILMRSFPVSITVAAPKLGSEVAESTKNNAIVNARCFMVGIEPHPTQHVYGPVVARTPNVLDLKPVGLAHAFAETKLRLPSLLAFLARGRGLLADIAAADHWVNAELLTTNRCPVRLNLHSAFGSCGIVPGAAARPILGTRDRPALHRVLMQVIQLFC